MMRAFEQAWALLKADPLAQGRMGSLRPDTVTSMIERQRAGNVRDFSELAAKNRAEQMANIQSIKDSGLPPGHQTRAEIMQAIQNTDPSIGVDAQGSLPEFIQHSGEARQGYPDVAQDITPLGETTMSRMGSGRNLEANLTIPITETMPEESFMTPPERRMARRGLGAARRRTESGARGDTGFTPYRTKEGMLADNAGVASPTRLRRDSKPTEARPMRTGKPTVDQNLADMLEQMAADNPNAKFDRPPEVDEKPEPKSGGFNEKLEAAGRGGRRFNRTQQSIAGQDEKPNAPIQGFERGSQPPAPMRGSRVNPQRMQQSVDLGNMDPEAMSQARLMELAAQLGKKNGASQTAVDQTA